MQLHKPLETDQSNRAVHTHSSKPHQKPALKHTSADLDLDLDPLCAFSAVALALALPAAAHTAPARKLAPPHTSAYRAALIVHTTSYTHIRLEVGHLVCMCACLLENGTSASIALRSASMIPRLLQRQRLLCVALCSADCHVNGMKSASGMLLCACVCVSGNVRSTRCYLAHVPRA